MYGFAFLLVPFLQVLETCVNNCGERFHNEIAKFRFLNELIKVLSPKVGGCDCPTRGEGTCCVFQPGWESLECMARGSRAEFLFCASEHKEWM